MRRYRRENPVYYLFSVKLYPCRWQYERIYSAEIGDFYKSAVTYLAHRKAYRVNMSVKHCLFRILFLSRFMKKQTSGFKHKAFVKKIRHVLFYKF